MLRGYKYRLYPNKAQAQLIDKHIGACRFVYNLALETKNHAYATHRKNLSCFELMGQLPDLKKECEWLKEIDSQSLQQSVIDLDKAFTAFFKGTAKFPNFKKKKSNQGFRNPHGSRVQIKDRKLYQPKFLEGISQQ
jgi:putative transposase